MNKDNLLWDCRVEAESVANFLARYYKPERYTSRDGPVWGYDYSKQLLASHEADFARYGFDVISCHDSITGTIVAFFGKEVV